MRRGDHPQGNLKHKWPQNDAKVKSAAPPSIEIIQAMVFCIKSSLSQTKTITNHPAEKKDYLGDSQVRKRTDYPKVPTRPEA